MLTKIYLAIAACAMGYYTISSFAGWESGTRILSSSPPSVRQSASSGRSSGGGGFWFGGGGGYGGGK